MELIKIHYKISKPVDSWGQIKDEAKEMLAFVDTPMKHRDYNKAHAIAHCQVSETPYAFFVVSGECVRDKLFESRVIINPEILAAPTHRAINQTVEPNEKGEMAARELPALVMIPNALEYREPCFSFPFRGNKRILRYDRIKVRYRIKTWWGLKTIERELAGVASQIFQHEYDHTQGKNIFFESECPVKWWELIGKDRPVGGTSLDQFDPTGLEPAREHETKNEIGT